MNNVTKQDKYKVIVKKFLRTKEGHDKIREELKKFFDKYPKM